MNDLISRRALLDTFNAWLNMDYSEGEMNILRACVDEIKSAPSPGRQPGEWLMKDVPAPGYVKCECSVCEDCRIVPDHEDDWFKRNFCPNCGADMKGDK